MLARWCWLTEHLVLFFLSSMVMAGIIEFGDSYPVSPRISVRKTLWYVYNSDYCVNNHNTSITSYTFTKVTFEFADMDPAQNTVEDLMLRICHLERVKQGVCLYTVDGMPLTDDPFFNTCKLKRSIFSVIMHHSLKKKIKQTEIHPVTSIQHFFL